MNTAKQLYKCYIRTLSPIHIGCDDVYEPTGFVMDEAARQIVVFNPFAFIEGMTPADREKFSAICEKGTVSSILEIYKFLKNRPAEGRRVSVCEDFIIHYNKTLSMSLGNERAIQQELNRFSIPRTAYLTEDQRPFIPGSSVKGALRTAYLNLLVPKHKPSGSPDPRMKGADLEKKLMDYSGIQDDPFRMVKVSDFNPVGDVQTRIIYGVNEKKRPSINAARGVPLIFEVITAGSEFSGVISVEQPLKEAGIRQPVELNRLLESATRFYGREKSRENQELQIIGIEPLPLPNDNGCLLRCGRHSGAESLTIEGFRSIKIMGAKGMPPKYKDSSTTLWLASDLKKPEIKKNLAPFGWAAVHALSDEDALRFSETERSFIKQRDLILEQKRADAEKIRKIKVQEAAEKQQKETEEREKAIAEEKRQAELAAMSPEDRMIAEITDPSVTENRVVEIFNAMNTFPEDKKPALATALKTYWQQIGKWKKKKCTGKQWEKVQAVKKILGEE